MADTRDKLASYLVDDLLNWMMEERRNLIEEQWRANDDAFRGRYDSSTLKKWKTSEGQGWRSKVFIWLTKQKVVTGYNNLLAVMLQGGSSHGTSSPPQYRRAQPDRFCRNRRQMLGAVE